MSRARCWNLRFNLDIFNSAFASLDTDQERSDFLIGLSRGANGGKVKDDCSDPMSVGYAIGTEMRGEAEAFRAKAVETGSMRKPNRNDHTVDGNVDHTVDQSGTQSTILNLQSTNDNPPSKKESSPSRARLSRKMKLSMLDGYPETALSVVRTLLPIWPEELPDGRKPAFDPHAASARVTEILDSNPSIQPQLLIDAGNRYLRTMRETGSEKFISALHFFFGPGKGKTMPKWEEQIRAMKHDQSLEQNEPTPTGQGETI